MKEEKLFPHQYLFEHFSLLFCDYKVDSKSVMIIKV